MNIPGCCYLSEEIGKPNDILEQVAVIGQVQGTSGMPET